MGAGSACKRKPDWVAGENCRGKIKLELKIMLVRLVSN
jgi:hypothetical protein